MRLMKIRDGLIAYKQRSCDFTGLLIQLECFAGNLRAGKWAALLDSTPEQAV